MTTRKHFKNRNTMLHFVASTDYEDNVVYYLVRRLLKKFMASSDEARQKFIGLHVGSFVIREWNPEQRYLQVGCHRFYEQTLKEFADYCERTTK